MCQVEASSLSDQDTGTVDDVRFLVSSGPTSTPPPTLCEMSSERISFRHKKNKLSYESKRTNDYL